MATSAVGPQGVSKNQNWKEVKAPDQFKWTKPGETIICILLSLEPVMVKGKPNVEYLCQLENGGRITMLETADLKKKITPSMIGYWLKIRYEKDERFESQAADQSAMKMFKVEIGSQAIAA